jgi:hypothetical protein
MASSGMLCRVAVVRTDISEELSASLIRVTRISELGTDERCEEMHLYRLYRTCHQHYSPIK